MTITTEPGGAYEYASSRITERYINVSLDARLEMHNVMHSTKTADLTVEIIGDAGGSQVQQMQGLYSGLFHDIVHIDDVVTASNADPLLAKVRTPRNDDDAEHKSASELREYLLKSGRTEKYAKAPCDAVVATSYRFVNGILVHPYIVDAVDPIVAFALAKADVLGPATIKNAEEMLSTTLRFFLEKYPDLTTFLHNSQAALPNTTHESLVGILKSFASDEIKFFTDQIDRLTVDADLIGLKNDATNKIKRRFNMKMFSQAHDVDSWDWLASPTLTTECLRRSLSKYGGAIINQTI